jgi:lipid-binding SYLF domain-containing protein
LSSLFSSLSNFGFMSLVSIWGPSTFEFVEIFRGYFEQCCQKMQIRKKAEQPGASNGIIRAAS